ncbi:MAG: tetratricopeptide repeat protein [Aquificae bacterium]|nr:tetratricopeptide repeat protein [Aquificota bacterium]
MYLIVLIVAAGLLGYSCGTTTQNSEMTVKKVVDEQTLGRINRAKKAVKVYTRTADGYYREGFYDKALVYYDKALLKLKYLNRLNHPQAAKIYVRMGDSYLKLKKKKLALEFYQKAYEIYKRFYGENNPRTVQVKEKINQLLEG